MNYKITIQENCPQATVLKNTINQLLGLVHADYIFLFTDETLPIPVYTITILMGEQQLSSELYEQINSIFKDYPFIRNRVFSYAYAKARLEDYNLYFIRNCMIGELIYSNTTERKAFSEKSLNIKILLEEAESRFATEKEKISTFRQGAIFYMQSGKYSLAAFTFQQAIELMFHTAGNFIMGKSLISHSLELQQKYIQHFAPSLVKIFDLNNKQEQQLLSLLDQSYLSVRYDNNFEITKKELENISYKSLLIEMEIEELFQISMREAKKKTRNNNQSHCEEKSEAKAEVIEIKASEIIASEIIDPEIIIPETILTTIIATSGTAPPLDDDLLQQIIGYITMYINVDAIYKFGHRRRMYIAESALQPMMKRDNIQFHYDLLIITEQTGRDAGITDIINTKTGGKCTITTLLHKSVWFESTPEERKYFINKVIQNAELVYQNEKFKGIGLQEAPERDIGALRTYWENRKIIALIFLEAESAMERPTGEQVQEAMLHQAIEHICLGLINIFLGYRPHHFALGYLFDLCENFSSLTADIFPRYTVEDRKLFKRLSANLSQLRHKELERISFTDTEVLHKRCWFFYKEATLLADKELERLYSQ